MVSRFFVDSYYLLTDYVPLNITGKDTISLARWGHDQPTPSPVHDKWNCHLGSDVYPTSCIQLARTVAILRVAKPVQPPTNSQTNGAAVRDPLG